MKYRIVDDGQGVALVLSEDLRFEDREMFDAAIDKLLARAPRQVVVEMSGLDYMDSAGLGMLLTLRDRLARANGGDAILRHPQGDVLDVLRLACFESLFVVEVV